MPADVTLPCATPHAVATFDAVLHVSPCATAHGAYRARVIAAAKAICGGCAHTVACLRENGDAAGVVAGLTASERGAVGAP